MNERGLIVGCDKNQEWLLPWWWEHYSAHNSFPVAFADFGMSEEALSWCRERGECLTLPETTILQENEILPHIKKGWKDRFGQSFWPCRSAWFKKPLALVCSPFSRGIWMDLDCQIRGSLEPLFHALVFGAEIGLVREPEYVQIAHENGGAIHYNSGVIVFCKSADILSQWVEEAFSNNGNYHGDQQALCMAIHLHRPILIELPPFWNWVRTRGPNPEALVYHFIGTNKQEIMQQMNSASMKTTPVTKNP